MPTTGAYQIRQANDALRSSAHPMGCASYGLKLVSPSESFLNTYKGDYDIGFNLSAKAEIIKPEVKGPTVFKKTKDVEFTIFLLYYTGQYGTRESYRQPLTDFIESSVVVFENLGIDGSKITEKSAEIVQHILSDDTMFKSP